MNGWIAFHRKFWRHWIYQDPEPFCKRMAWLDLISQCDWEGPARGSTLVSMSFLARRWRWSESKVRRFLARLQADGMIDGQPTDNRTRLSVLKYEEYQRVLDVRETGATDNRRTTDGRSDDNKTIRNKTRTKEKKKEPISITEIALPLTFHERAQKALETWLEYKQQIKDAYKSNLSVAALLEEWADKPDDFCAAVKKSISNGWKGLFPPDRGRGAGKPTTLERVIADTQNLFEEA